MFFFFPWDLNALPKNAGLVAGQSLRGEPVTAFEEGTRQNRVLVPHSLSIRDGPLEKLKGGGGGGIFEPQEFLFWYQIPRMNFF